MDDHQRLPFEVGQLAEAKSFKNGFRGAWFRCNIKEIKWKQGILTYLLEYYDFPDEKETWTRVYQFPTWTKKAPKQLMVRPEYPPLYHPNQLPAVDSRPNVIVVADGTWRVGDFVDWRKDDCYWSGKVTSILGTGKAEIEFPPPPIGEGSVYEVPFENLRPSLDWSPENGWLVPTSTDAGSSPQSARLIHKKTDKASVGHLLQRKPTLNKRTANNSTNTNDTMMAVRNQTASSVHDTTRATTSCDELMSEKPEIMKDSLSQASNLESNLNSVPENNGTAKEAVLSNSDSGSLLGDGGQTHGKGTDGPDLIRKRFKNSESIPLNSMRSNTIEAAIVDFEEVANKIRWLKSILKATDSTSNPVRPLWKFIEHRASSTSK